MRMRKNSYDLLDLTIKNLQQKLNHHQDAIVKADIHDSSTIHKCIQEFDSVNSLCKSLTNQFLDAKDDFNGGRINLVKYREKLKSLKNLLTERDSKITNPHLDTVGMVREIKRFL